MQVPTRLASIEEARSRILAEASPLGVESQPLSHSLGMVMAQDLVARYDLCLPSITLPWTATRCREPAWPGNDLRRSRSWAGLAAVDVSAAEVGEGEALRIMTGAPMPQGADASSRQRDSVEYAKHHMQQERPAGGDVVSGSRMLLGTGTVFGAGEVGMVASLGLEVVTVRGRPRVAVRRQ